jgi:hypothetical protein
MFFPAFILTLLVVESFCEDCPPADVLKPCECVSGRYLTTNLFCQGININESNISDIKNNMKLKNVDPVFNSIAFIQTSITRLERDVFSNFTANNISFFDNRNLEYVYIEDDSKKIVQVFRIMKSISFKESEIIKSVNQYFPNLTVLEITGTSIAEVPDNAFNKKTKSNLNKINLSGNNITRLGKEAFNLTDITEIDLSKNKLMRITRRNFILDHIKNSLIIDLQNNFLNESSFEKDFFNSTQPIVLNLQNNKLKELKETIFRPMTESMLINKIELFGNPFTCDCSSKWITEIDKNSREKFNEMMCPNTKSIQEFYESDFYHCSPNATTISSTNNTSNVTLEPTLNSSTDPALANTTTAIPTTHSSSIIPSTTQSVRVTSSSPKPIDPFISLKNKINSNISAKSNISRNMITEVKKLEEETNHIRTQLNANISHLKEFMGKIDIYNDKYKDDFQISLFMQQSKDEIQNLLKTFISISDKLNQLVNN